MNRKSVKPLLWLCLLLPLLLAAFGCLSSQGSGYNINRAVQLATNPNSISANDVQNAAQGIGQALDNYSQSNISFPPGRPVDFQAFKERYKTVGASPQGAVRMYFDALYSYIDPARHSEGAKMLRYSMHEKQGWEKSGYFATFVSRLKDPSYHYIFRSFAAGTSPQNSYAMNPDNYQLMFKASRQETDYVLISIASSGADSPRSVHVKQFEDGLWYVVNNHGTYSEVRQPASQTRGGGHDADMD